MGSLMTIGLYLSERKGYSNEINNTEAGKKLEYATLGWEAPLPLTQKLLSKPPSTST